MEFFFIFFLFRIDMIYHRSVVYACILCTCVLESSLNDILFILCICILMLDVSTRRYMYKRQYIHACSYVKLSAWCATCTSEDSITKPPLPPFLSLSLSLALSAICPIPTYNIYLLNIYSDNLFTRNSLIDMFPTFFFFLLILIIYKLL